MPPLPSVPVALENEMAYNAYFGSLHLATDAVSAVMRRQRMAYPEVTASRARARARSSTRSSGRGGGGGGGVTGRSPAARSGGFGGGMAAYGGYGGYSPRDRGGGGGGAGRGRRRRSCGRGSWGPCRRRCHARPVWTPRCGPP